MEQCKIILLGILLLIPFLSCTTYLMQTDLDRLRSTSHALLLVDFNYDLPPDYSAKIITWDCVFLINGETYYLHQFKSNQILEIPIPVGKIKFQYSLTFKHPTFMETPETDLIYISSEETNNTIEFDSMSGQKYSLLVSKVGSVSEKKLWVAAGVPTIMPIPIVDKHPYRYYKVDFVNKK